MLEWKLFGPHNASRLPHPVSNKQKTEINKLQDVKAIILNPNGLNKEEKIATTSHEQGQQEKKWFPQGRLFIFHAYNTVSRTEKKFFNLPC